MLLYSDNTCYSTVTTQYLRRDRFVGKVWGM